MPWNLDALLTGGVGATIVVAAAEVFHILLNKKVRTPADLASQRRADIVERNELMDAMRADMAGIRAELAECKKEVVALRAEVNKLEEANDILKESALARDHYIYRCISVIQRLGAEHMIPEPKPTGFGQY